MTVYVDNYPGKFKGRIWNHLVADTTEELISFAVSIGLKSEWLQNAGKYHEHFDVFPNMRVKALAAGAVPIDFKKVGEIVWAKRKNK